MGLEKLTYLAQDFASAIFEEGYKAGYNDGYEDGASDCEDEMIKAISDGFRKGSSECAKVIRARRK